MSIPVINKLKTTFGILKQKKFKIDSGIVGTQLKPYLFTVEDRHVSNFAAAIGDENSHYYVSANTNILCSHPVFPVRISWEIIKNLSLWLKSEVPFDLNTPLVHHSEYLEIQRLPKPGDQLTLSGQIAAFLPHSRGSRLVLRFSYVDKQKQPLLTEFVTAILFNVRCADAGKQLDLPPAIQRVTEDKIIWEEQIAISRLTPFIYDGCTDIVYGIHTDQKFALRMGLPDIILQGTATLAISISTILKKELNCDPQTVRLLAGKFTDIVVPPNRLTVRLLKQENNQFYFDVHQKNGNFVIRGGYLKTI
jgi:hypothetical protein